MADNFNRNKWVNLNNLKISAIHYLFASKGQALMSRWGHAMIRLVVCAPNETPAQCVKNKEDDLIVSFAANTGPQIDYIKGIVGGYDSIAFFKTMSAVVEEYNLGELRDLESYALDLTGEQVKKAVIRLVEIFWSYKGNYKFFSNNCSDEVLDFFQFVFNMEEIDKLEVISPLQLKKKLSHLQKIPNLNKEEYKKELIQNGLILPSHTLILNKALKSIGHLIAVRDLKSYLNKSSENVLNEIQEQLLKEDEYQRIKMLFSYKKLEEYRITQIKNEFMLEFNRFVFKHNELKKLQSSIGNSSFKISSNTFYGIPLDKDVELESSIVEYEKKGLELFTMVKDLNPVLINTYIEKKNAIKRNIEQLEEIVFKTHQKDLDQ